MLKRFMLLAAIAGALVAFAGSAGAITGNYTDDFVHDNVGLLVFYTPSTPAGEDPFSHRCSGTLISPTVVVTAGHCTTGVNEGRIYFQQSAAPNYDPNAFGGRGRRPDDRVPVPRRCHASTGPTTTASSRASRRRRTPASSSSTRPVTPANGFGILPAAGAIDRYIAAAGDKKQARFTISGYGLSDQDPRPVSFRKRLMATSYAINNEAPITEFNLKTTANASQGKGGTCNGDSGGPVFFYGTNVIAAVTSFGQNGQCKGQDFSYRLDRPEVLSWITNPNRVDAG